MKRIIYFLLISFVVFSYMSFAQDLKKDPNVNKDRDPPFECHKYYKWVTIFEDHFDGTELDTINKWRYYYPWMRKSYCGAGELGYNSYDNLIINNGNLEIWAKEDNFWAKVLDHEDRYYELECDGVPINEWNFQHFYYTSGMIFSKEVFTWPCYFEIRCKVPDVQDFVPAFWLYGECAQEIDIFEFLDNKNYVVNTNHHWKVNCSGDAEEDSFAHDVGINLANDFYIYSFEWNQLYCKWQVRDGSTVLAQKMIYKYQNLVHTDLQNCGDLNVIFL